MDYTNLILGILSIVGSAITAYLAYGIYRHNRLSKAWLMVVVAFVLIIFRRTLGYAMDMGYLADLKVALKEIEGVLLLVISVLYIIGFWSMKKNFENFDVIEKKTKEKIKAINAKRGKRSK